MAVLETFIHDPLCEWSKNSNNFSASIKSTTKDGPAEIDKEEAVKHLKKIEKKLQGTKQFGLPLSIEGQVQELISEATDPKNLCVMYIGIFFFQPLS